MSVWDPRPEENDDAADWLAELADEPSVLMLNDAFDEVLNNERDEYLEITECANAVAAAAVVAEMLGRRASASLLEAEDLAQLRSIAKKLALGARISLVERALQSLEIVATDSRRSELYQVWQEDRKGAQAWSRHNQALKQWLERRLQEAKHVR